jgi:hypothetical protein
MLQSLAKRTEKDHIKVVGMPRQPFSQLVQKWAISLPNRPGPRNLLSPAAQVLTYILYLRHYTRPLLAALYMNVGKTTIRDTLVLLGEFFFRLLAPLISFGTYEQRKAAAFQYFNEQITYLVDGSVQEIHTTKDLGLEGSYFSGKNGVHTLTLLVFTNPQKRLLGMMPCLYGCVKDDDLLIRTADIWV